MFKWSELYSRWVPPEYWFYNYIFARASLHDEPPSTMLPPYCFKEWRTTRPPTVWKFRAAMRLVHQVQSEPWAFFIKYGVTNIKYIRTFLFAFQNYLILWTLPPWFWKTFSFVIILYTELNLGTNILRCNTVNASSLILKNIFICNNLIYRTKFGDEYIKMQVNLNFTLWQCVRVWVSLFTDPLFSLQSPSSAGDKI